MCDDVCATATYENRVDDPESFNWCARGEAASTLMSLARTLEIEADWG